MGYLGKFIGTVALATSLGATAAAAWPDSAITLVVPYAAGGGPDVHTRQFAQKFSAALNVPVVVENRVGAAGAVGTSYVSRARADGHTLLLGTNAHLLQKAMQPELAFDPLTDFRGISNIMSTPAVVVVGAESPYETVQDLIDALKREPDLHNYGSGGIGTPAHVSSAALLAHFGATAQHIPLRGSAEIMPSLMRGDVTFAAPVAGTALPQIQNGMLRALAVTSKERIPNLPDVPSLYEITGDPQLVLDTWLGLWTPADTPDERVDALFTAADTALQDPELQSQFASAGTIPTRSESPAQYDQLIAEDNDKWSALSRLTREDALPAKD
ncbi:MAG: Bug family tripartite tricarboxylate transporter substrate binding protein [Pigmentiphaga sp.]